MKYLLLFSSTRSSWQQNGMATWPKKDMEAHMAQLKTFNQDLRASGEYVSVEALTPPEQATIVRADDRGAPVTDGVFPESKEFLVGFLIVDCESERRAHEIAARWSAMPGKGGVPLKLGIEVRPVMSFPPSHAADDMV